MKRFLLTVALLLISFLIFAQERIAVFPFEDMDNLLTKNESVLFYRQFSNEFTNKNAGKFIIVPRQDVEKLFSAEEKFQLSDLSAKAKTAETQRVLNGTQILSGAIGKVGSRITISVSLYTFPELSQLPGGVDKRVANKDELFDKITELVQDMQDRIAGERGTGGNQPPQGKIYKIGDIGPAGGIVFYDKGTFSNGWRYLEAAPVETEFNAQWGTWDEDVVGTSTVVGSGKRNTQLIIDRLKKLGEDGKAAQLCVSLNFDGYTDWFLPSKDELNLMYKNLKQKELGGFGDSWKWYWSSSQYSTNIPWYQSFKDGLQYNNASKHYEFSVRAVRAF